MLTNPSPDQRPTRCRRGCPLPHQTEAPLSPVNTHVYTLLAALKVTFYFHLYFSTGEELFPPRLNMTSDKDVFVVPSHDILGAWC